MPVSFRNSKPIFKALTALACLAASTQPVLALSCMRMGPGDVYRIVSENEDPFVVLEGALSFDASLLPKAYNDNPSKSQDPARIQAHFSGLMLGKRIFDQVVEGELTLEVHCLGPWCGNIESDRRYLFFARQTEQGVVAVVEPCKSFFFDAEQGAPGDVVLQCHRGGTCPSLLPDRLEKDTTDQDVPVPTE